MKKLVLVAVCCMCMVSIAFADETKKMKCFSSMDGFYQSDVGVSFIRNCVLLYISGTIAGDPLLPFEEIKPFKTALRNLIKWNKQIVQNGMIVEKKAFSYHWEYGFWNIQVQSEDGINVKMLLSTATQYGSNLKTLCLTTNDIEYLLKEIDGYDEAMRANEQSKKNSNLLN